MPLFNTYVPIDVAGPALVRCAAGSGATAPDLKVVPIAADFMHPLRLPLAWPAWRALDFSLAPRSATLIRLRRHAFSIGRAPRLVPMPGF